MSKQAWGTKRLCPDCGARFYDLNKDPIVCPKCQKVYEPEANKPARRSRPVPVPKKPAPAELEPPDAGRTDDAERTGEEEEEVLEDASELGEDDDDVAEVIEKADDGDER